MQSAPFPFPSSAPSLRDRLRRDSRAEHARVDAAVGALDLGQAGDLGRFLAAHHAAFRAIAPAARGTSRGLVADLAARLEADLTVLGRAALPAAPQMACDPVAVDYVVLGSRLGTAVLRRRWAAAAGGRAAGAGRYLTAPGQGAAWRTFCAAQASRPGTGPAAERIVGDVRRLFDLFDRALARAAGRETALA